MIDTIGNGPSTGGTSAGLVDRVKAILFKPKQEWPVIAAEPTTPGDVITRYVVPLAAIGPVCALIGGQVFGYGAFGFSFRPSLVFSISHAIVSYVMTIVGVVIVALIADYLAPKFDGESNRTAAFKLVAYGATASFVAAVFQLFPPLAVLGILGLYSFYLFYTGVCPVMRVPQDKAVSYTVVTFLAAIVVLLVVGVVTSTITGIFGSPYRPGGIAAASGTLHVPGVGSVDMAKMQAASRQMEDAANGKHPAVDPAKLQGFLPASIGGYQRTALESSALGPMGSEAEGTYTSGDKSFRLKITDMAALGGLTAMGTAMGMSQSKQDADGYERTSTVNGQLQTEEWHNAAHNGKFGVAVGNRFMVEAEGQAGSIDELKQAVAAVDPGQLQAVVS
ncbi:MAG: YIP1 family protein [Novosphingobium sp.]|nr:YIP1 family protein [Novosphingobium sp.]